MRGIIYACLVTVAFVIFTLAVVLAACGQTLVSIERADVALGPQHIECWLDPKPAAAQYVTGTLLVDCRGHLERIFRNGFEVDA